MNRILLSQGIDLDRSLYNRVETCRLLQNTSRWLSVKDFDGELWKDIDGYYGRYQVSNFGRIKSLYKKPHIMRQCSDRQGYLKITFIYNYKSKTFFVHRLVSCCFLKNPHSYNEINHIDEDKTNNTVVNLEWCSHVHNVHWGTSLQRISSAHTNHPSLSFPVKQYSMSGELLNTFPSCADASRKTGILVGEISRAARGVYPSYKSFVWIFADDNYENWRARNALEIVKFRNRSISKFSLMGDFITKYKNSKEAASELGNRNKSTRIIACCKGKINAAYGYIWRFSDGI